MIYTDSLIQIRIGLQERSSIVRSKSNWQTTFRFAQFATPKKGHESSSRLDGSLLSSRIRNMILQNMFESEPRQTQTLLNMPFWKIKHMHQLCLTSVELRLTRCQYANPKHSPWRGSQCFRASQTCIRINDSLIFNRIVCIYTYIWSWYMHLLWS